MSIHRVAITGGARGSVTLINTGVLLDYKWHRLARILRTPVAGELFTRTVTHRLARLVLRHDNPGLDAYWVNQIAEHLLPAGTKHAVLRLYRSTRSVDIDALVEPLRNRDPETLVVLALPMSTSRSSRPNASAACFRMRELRSCPVSVTGRGSSSPSRLPGSSSRSCVNG
ncbi:MAG: hypothetical protein ACLQLO_08375 [Mycobacterium sp.]